MAEHVLLAVPSWTPDKSDGGVYIALPVACSDCTIRSTELPFFDCDPFQRGLLLFLLAGVKRTSELADLLGISDAAFVDLMIDELERRGLVRKGGLGEVALTQKATEIYRSAPGSISQQIFGRVLYSHDGTRGYVVAGPLDQDSRIEMIGELVDGVGRISVGTEGKPLYMECITPRMPTERPAPMTADDAQRGISAFVKHAGNRSSISRGAPRGNFTVVLQEPRWERLLVRVVSASGSRPQAKHRRGRQSDLSILIGQAMHSPHLFSHIQRLERSNDQFKLAFSRRLVRPKPSAEKDDKQSDPTETTPAAPPTITDDEVTESPTVVDTSLSVELSRALCDRAAAVSAGLHVPLVEDRSTTNTTVRARFQFVGFTTTSASGGDVPFPHIPDQVIAQVRRSEWGSVDHLWAAFCAWTLMESADAVRAPSVLIPDLPWRVAEAHWALQSSNHNELQFLLDHVSSLGEDPI